MRIENREKRRSNRRRIRTPILYYLFLILLLSGCKADFLPYGREVENMALMRTMGVDVAEGDGVTVTVSSGVQSQGVNEGREPPTVFSQKAGTVSGACLAMQSQGESYIFYGHVGQMLFGEQQAARGVAEALEYVERDIEMRLDTQLFVVKGGTAGDAIEMAAGQSSAATDRLEALEEDAGLMPAFMPRTVKEVLAAQAQNGASFVPALTAVGEGENADLIPAGYAILQSDALVGWAEGETARGVNLLCDSTDADMLELTTGTGDKVALRLVGAKTSVHSVFNGETLVGLDVDCKIEANVAEAPAGLRLADEKNRDWLQNQLAAVTQRRMRSALDLSQALGADFLGLGKQAGLAEPWHWAELQTPWGAAFGALPITVRVEAKILRGYDMKG